MDNKKARKALRESIKHWCIDIRKPLLDGDTIYNDCWKEKKTEVKMFSDDCSLCAIYECTYNCPLIRIDEDCTYGHSAYNIFYNNRDLKSANNMIATLIKAYKEVL